MKGLSIPQHFAYKVPGLISFFGRSPKYQTNSVELRVPLERPQVVQPFDSFPTSYGTRRFITTFTRDLHLYLS
jgi:hypothetical protein